MPPADAQPGPRTLRWALVIATYKRREILLRCLQNALRQTRMPDEIVVVDASPDFDVNRDAAMALLSSAGNTRVVYEAARRASLPVQRNQGIELASADIVFLIDDDSMMYPDCAAEVMKVYEHDARERVSGVMCMPETTPPDAEHSSSMGASGNVAVQPKQTPLRRLVKSLLNTEATFFLPYDARFPEHEVPSELRGLEVDVIQVMPGYAMTFRRSVLQKEAFCEMLERYAAGEDQDVSYRASRHGALLLAHKARLCHLEISGGRLSRRTTTALADLNPAALQVLFSDDIERSRRDWQRIVRKRLLIRALKDLSEKEWRFQRTRGTLLALRRLGQIYDLPPDALRTWYGGLQKELIDQDVSGA